MATNGRKTILIIDDDPDMRTISHRFIARAGYTCLGADSGQEGLQKIQQHEPDLVLLDYFMPVMSGEDVFMTLNTDPQFKKHSGMPVIMLTARTEINIDRSKLFEMGLSAFLIKPFGHRELINIIDNVLILNRVHMKNKELEARVKLSEYKYQDLIENAHDIIFILDSNGCFVFLNRRFGQLTGYHKDDWRSKSFLEWVDTEYQAEMRSVLIEAITGRERMFEVMVTCRGDKKIHLSTNITPLFERGRVRGLVGIARDITQRKKLEKEIIDLKNFNESIIQSMGSGLITVDLARRITSFNNGAEEVLGYRANDVIGASLDNILPAEESHKLLPYLDGQQQSPLNRELELTAKNGRRVDIGYSVTPRYDNHGHNVGTIISFRDISEIKRMQAEVIRMDRLASLGVLASGIAHEIRNPLAGIKTMAQTLEEEMDEDDGRGEYIARIIRQVNRLDELLKTFFSYARPRQPISKAYQLKEIIHEVYALLEKKIAGRNITFSENYAYGLPEVFVDYHQVQQVLLNLFLNAVDAMPQGGMLNLEASQVHTKLEAVDRRRGYVPPTKSSNYVQLEISDNGTGIDVNNLEQIFDPFFTTKPQGAGLGLSIVYRIVKEHGGEINVRSAPGEGTCFTLLLPTEE